MSTKIPVVKVTETRRTREITVSGSFLTQIVKSLKLRKICNTNYTFAFSDTLNQLFFNHKRYLFV